MIFEGDSTTKSQLEIRCVYTDTDKRHAGRLRD